MKAVKLNRSVKSNMFTRFNKKTTSAKLTYVLFFIYFLVLAAIMLLPFYITIMNSFRTIADYRDIKRGVLALPAEWDLSTWGKIFTDFQVKGNSFWVMLFNSLWIITVKVTCNVMSSTLLAYAVSRFRFPGKNFLYGLAIFVRTVPIIGSSAAGYKLGVALHLVNNPALIWISWLDGFDFAFIILYGVFKGVSMSYSESAKIDGAGQFRILFQIVMPQALPAITALAITQALGVWNDYNTSMIALRKYPNLAYGLFVFEEECSYIVNSHAVYSAAIILSAIPIIIIYSAAQKLILTNLTTGGLKG